MIVNMLKGIYTPIITTFNEDGSLDLESNGKLIDYLIENGVNGILFLGSIGEFFTLTHEEKKEYIQFAIKRVNKRAVAMAGTGGTAVDEVIDLTRFAEKEGADAAVVISPYYFKLDEKSLYRYYADVASSVKMPIFLYNFPDRTAVDLSPQLVLRLAKDFTNIVGIKESVDNISHTRKTINLVKPQRPDFSVLSGYDEYFIPNLMAGGDGILSGLTNIAPKYFVEMYKAFLEKDFDAMSALQKKINILMELYDVSQPFVGAIKEATTQMVEGIKSECRKPSGALTIEQKNKVAKILLKAELGLT